jgi:peptidylprolyl isomerase
MKKLQTEEWVAVVVGLALVVAALFYGLTGGLLQTDEVTNNQEPMTDETRIDEDIPAVEASDELQVITLEPGEGEAAEVGDVVIVHYRGWLQETGEQFDTSYDRGQPFPVQLGQGQVIQGWEQGLIGVQPGELRLLVIPSDLAYGEVGTPGGPIPANADLVFGVEVVEVITAEQLQALPQQ